MKTANLELCRELFILSKWEGDGTKWGEVYEPWGVNIPAYNLGYLIRKLPNFNIQIKKHTRVSRISADKNHTEYIAEYRHFDAGEHIMNPRLYAEYADTPEDAAAKLCCQLFQQGILG